MPDPVPQKPHVAIGFINLICYRIFVEKCNKFIAACGNKGADDTAISDRGNSGKTKGPAAAEQKHQHQFGIVVSMMAYRNFMVSVPAADAVKKIIADLSCGRFERKFLQCRIISNINGFAVAGKVQACSQIGNKVRIRCPIPPLSGNDSDARYRSLIPILKPAEPEYEAGQRNRVRRTRRLKRCRLFGTCSGAKWSAQLSAVVDGNGVAWSKSL